MKRLYMLIPTLATALGLVFGCTSKKEEPLKSSLTPITSADLKKLVGSSGKASVVNLWATWCEPCKVEMPEIRDFIRSSKGKDLQLILISADKPEDQEMAAKFLKDLGINEKAYILIEDPDSFGKAWAPTWSATLPTTFVTDVKGAVKTFWVGETNQKLLGERVEKALGPATAGPALQRHAK